MEQDVINVIPKRVCRGDLKIKPITEHQQRPVAGDPKTNIAGEVGDAERQEAVVEYERSVEHRAIRLKAGVSQREYAGHIPPSLRRWRGGGGDHLEARTFTPLLLRFHGQELTAFVFSHCS